MIIILKKPVFNVLKKDLVDLNIIKKIRDRDGDYGHDYVGVGRHGKGEYNGQIEVDLSALTDKETKKLLQLLESKAVHGSRVAAADIKKYLKMAKMGVESARARNCRQASWMLEFYFASLPHHIIFQEDAYGGKSYSGYWVGDVDYYPEEKATRRGELSTPEHMTIDIFYIKNDARKMRTITFWPGDCYNRTCVEILDGKGFVPETEALITQLRKETERFYQEKDRIGKQFWAGGLGLGELDDETEDDNRWGFSHGSDTKLDLHGRTKVVIDILSEKGDDKKESNASIDPFRWHKWNMRFHSPSEDELIRHLEADDDTTELVDVEVPVHPLVPCFNLQKHERMLVHINNLVPYEYNTSVAERLVLPERDWRMVNLLVDHSTNSFEDIVVSKGQSMNVLAVGPPGTGKTATAEVFAEFKKRPLYTVQCSQLGMTAQLVEQNLTVVMRRANRWNAVLLLDEADVYIRKRGADLQQNAIVGAFLRVLEYASCILFMTTNLGDEVDDAVTSRCIAKLEYGIPSPLDQKKIWKILAKLNKLDFPDSEIDKVISKHPAISGRDVKNLLKLASFVSQAEKKPLNAKMIEYVIQFKPTESFFRDTKGFDR